MKGNFITFEGIDGSGKTTQSDMLLDFFNQMGERVIKTREPGGTEVGEKIRDLLLNYEMNTETELMLFHAARKEHFGFIKSHLKEGYFVISDRFFDSSSAYQTAKDKSIFHLDFYLKKFLFGRFEPDITFLLDADPEDVLDNSTDFNRFENKDIDFHKRVRNKFLKISELEEERFVVLDATKNKHDLHSEIVDKLYELNFIFKS